MKTYSVFTVLFVFAISSLLALDTADALAIKGKTNVLSTKRSIETAQKLGLTPTSMEKRVTLHLVQMKAKNPAEFQEVLGEKLNNSSEFQSWAYAVRDNAEHVERAKMLAKLELFNSMQDNWSKVQATTVNKSATEDWKTFQSDLVSQLNGLEYRQKTDEGDYLFSAGDWAVARVTSDFAKVTWTIKLDAQYDNNRLKAGVEEITVPSDKRN